MSLKVNFCNTEFKNPLVLSAGILGTTANMLIKIAESGAGAVTTKSIGYEPRDGHNNPTVLSYGPGLINAVGLPSAGYKNMEDEWKELKLLEVPLIASIYGSKIAEYVEIAEFLNIKKPAIIELNVSCPNSEKHGMPFGIEKEIVSELIREVKKITKIPVMPKLTPNCLNIAEIAKACEEAGADAISAINTVGPGMLIDINAKKPVLYFKTGGLSGPAIRPVAVRCIYQVYEKVNIPILGMGGVSSGEDAIELMMAGASLVGIGSAIYYHGLGVFQKINNEIEQWLEKNNYKSVKEIIGAAHE